MNIPMGSGSVYFEKLLKGGFGAYLYCDGYVGYKKLENITLCTCLVHAKRKFHEALITSLDREKAKTGVNYLCKLFMMEDYANK
ncbi:MAG: transposase [Acutalibacteraceae bacterium]|nr:transposase [Acutalibacteraceae bacterium]